MSKILFAIVFLWTGIIMFAPQAYGAACGGGTCTSGNVGQSYNTACDPACTTDGRTCSDDPSCYDAVIDCNIDGCPDTTPHCGGSYDPATSAVVCGDWGGCYSLCYNPAPTPTPTFTPTPTPTPAPSPVPFLN